MDYFRKIPKIIHQTWKTNEIPLEWQEHQKTWKTLFPEPDYKYMFWTDHDNRNLIKTKFSWFLPIYDGYAKNIERADAIRYFILYEYGGIYADMDYSVRYNFYESLVSGKINVVQDYRNVGTISNFLMASPVKNKLWKDVFRGLVENRNHSYTLQSTGPAMLSSVLLGQDIHILPFETYNPPNPEICFLYKIFSLNILFRYYNFNLWNHSFGNHHNSESWGFQECQHFVKQHAYLVPLLLCSFYFFSTRFFFFVE